ARAQRRRQGHLHGDDHGLPQAAARLDQPLRRGRCRSRARRDRAQRHLPGAAGAAHVPHPDRARKSDGGGAAAQERRGPLGGRSRLSTFFPPFPPPPPPPPPPLPPPAPHARARPPPPWRTPPAVP